MAFMNREAVLRQLGEAIMGVDPKKVDGLVNLILASNEVFCLGCGRSGLAARGFAMRLMHLGRKVSVVGDTLAHAIGPGDLLLVISASGQSQSLRLSAEKAKGLGASVALVTASKNAPLAEMADVVVAIQAPSKEDTGASRASVLPMGSLFEEAAFVLLDILILNLMPLLGETNASMSARHANLE